MTTSEAKPLVRIDALLEQTGWVRSLARRLVRDPDRADDVAQEAMLRAIENPPDRRGSLRSWLWSVTSRIARQADRSDRRRAEREHAVSRGDPAPDTHGLAEEAESQRVLISAVLDLPEPYRTTVLLRYFREMSSREIAHTLGVPGSTVRNRLHRAAERLRVALDGRYDGDRKAWCLAFLPLAMTCARGMPHASALGSATATGAASAGGGATGLKLATGILAMSVKTKGLVSAGILVATIAGIAYFASPPTGQDDPPKGSPVTADDTARANESVPADRDAEMLPAWSSEDETGASDPRRVPAPSLAGVVTDLDGNPIEGAVLEPVSLADTREAPDYLRATTDADGRFSIATDDVVAVRLRAEAEGFFHDVDLVSPDRDAEIRLAPAARLAGRVTDATSGDPVASVRLEWDHHDGCVDCVQRARTGVDGIYRFDRLPEGASMTLRIAAEGYPADSRTFALEPGDNRLDIRLEAGIPLIIEVLDLDSREPLAGASVWDAGRGKKYGTTDADGRLALRALPETIVDPQIDFCVIVSGYCGVRRMLPEPDDLEPGATVRFLLPRGAVVEGRVLAADGTPVARAQLRTRSAGNTWGRALHDAFPGRFDDLSVDDRLTLYTETRNAETDDSGSFRLEGLPVGDRSMEITVSHADHAPTRAKIAEPRLPGDVIAREIILTAAGSIEGRIVIDGKPAKTRLRWNGPKQSGYGFSDERGSFRFDRVEVGEVTVGGFSPDMVPTGDPLVSRKVTVRKGETVRCDLKAKLEKTWISGHAMTERGEGVAGLTVFATDRVVRGHAVTDDTGAYRIELPRVRETSFYVSVSFGKQNQTRSREGVLPGWDDVDFVIPDLGTLPIRVVRDDTGDPLSGYVIRAISPEGDSTLVRVGRPHTVPSPDGTFELELPAGRYDLAIHHVDRSFRPGRAPGVVVTPGVESAPTEIRLERSVFTIEWDGDLSGLAPVRRCLMLLPEAGASDAWVELSAREVSEVTWNSSITIHIDPGLDHTKHFAQIDASGRHRLEGLEPGRYRFRSWPDDLIFEPEVIDVPDEADASITVRWQTR